MKKIKDLFQENKKEYEVINQHPITKAIVKSLTSVLSVVLMCVVIWNCFNLIMPEASMINIVNGESMMPTLKHGQVTYTDMDEIAREDIVIIKPHDDKGMQNVYIVKRVIGMPGDRLIIEKDGVYINGVKYIESYLIDECVNATYIDGGCNSVLLDDNEYFVMGDNRGNSHDSRKFGVVYDDEILYVQSETPTANTFFKAAIILLVLALITLLYGLVEFIVTECAYAILIKIIKTNNNERRL